MANTNTVEETPTSPEQEHKFPWQQLTILAFIRLGEPIAFVSVIAYIYVYVKDIRESDDNAAFYAGLLVSAFAVAEVLTTMQWGMISDKYGRKPIVLFALIGTAVSNLVFGFATNYWVALASRFIGGLLNGNVGVMQTMVAEMCKVPEHEPKAYSMIPFVWSVGSIMGAAMGGYLAKPAEQYPQLFSSDGIFGKYPYLLPNIVSAVYLVLAVVLGIVLLEETNEVAVPFFGTKTAKPPTITVDEHTALLSPTVTESEESPIPRRTRRESSIIAPNEPLTASTTVDIRRLSVLTTEDNKPIVTMTGPASTENATAEEQSRRGYSWEMILLIAQLLLMSYHSMAYNTLLAPFILDKPLKKGLDLKGGLGYTLHDVGGFLAIHGFIAMFIQVIIFPPFVAKVGVWKSVLWLTLLSPVAQIAMPFVTMLPCNLVPAGIYVDLVWQNFVLTVLYPCLLILLKNATPSLSMLGQVNGLAMAGTSGSRTIAAPLAGAMYSNGGSAAGWWGIAVFAILSVVLLFFMKRPDEDGDKSAPETG